MLSIGFNEQQQHKQLSAPQPKKEVIQAVSVDQSKVMAKVKELKRAEQQKAKQAESEINKLKRERIAEEKRLKAARQKQAAEQSRLKKAKNEYNKKKKAISNLSKQEKKLKDQTKAKQEQLSMLKKEADEKSQEKKNIESELTKLKNKEKKEKQKLAEINKKKEKAEKLAAQAKKQAAKERLEQLRVQSSSESLKKIEHFKAVIKQQVQMNWIKPDSMPKGLKCKLRVNLISGGIVSSVSVIESSGNSAFDNSAIRAVRKSAPFSLPDDPDLFAEFKELILPFNPS